MDGLETRTDQPAGEEHRAARAVGVLPSEEHRLLHRLVRRVRVHLRQQRNLAATRAPSSKQLASYKWLQRQQTEALVRSLAVYSTGSHAWSGRLETQDELACLRCLVSSRADG